MTNEEYLKIYSAYLPYRPKVEFTRNIYPCRVEIQTLDLDTLKLCLHPPLGSFKIKPILYDLSYLTKEIEHEGETFIPIEKLFGSALAISGYTVYKDFQYKEFAHLTYVKDGLKPFPFLFEHYQKLFEWHFNVFQLPEDQFINKATLTNK